VRELRQPHMRGGAREPLEASELTAKFEANLAFGGVDAASVAALRAALERIAGGGAVELAAARA